MAPTGADDGGRRPSAIVLVNNQPFAIRMPMEVSGITGDTAEHLMAEGAAVQPVDSGVVLIGSVNANASRRLALLPASRRSEPDRRLVIDTIDDGVRVSFDGQPIGNLSWSVHLSAAASAPKTSTATPPQDLAHTFEALPLEFTRTVQGHVFDTWTAKGSRHGLSVALTLRAYREGFLDLSTRVTTEPDARTSGVYAAVVSRLTHAADAAERRICYDNRIAPLAATGRTPFRAGEGRHHFVQRGVDWLTLRTAAGASVAWMNDFADSFTILQDSSENRFRQPRYTGANIPQLGSEAQAAPEALFWITEIARTNIQSYRDRLVDNILPPAGESVSFGSRLAFEPAPISDVRATEQFLAYTGYWRQDRRDAEVTLSFGVPHVRFGTSYFPYSTLGENFDRLKLPGMDSEGYWPLAADTVQQWPLFADAIRRDLRIAKAMGFHVIRLHYLDVIAQLDARVQREYLDFLFSELRHLKLRAMLSPSDARFTPAQMAAMVSRYRDVVESVELENEILIWGIPQDRPRYWNAVYDAVKSVAPRCAGPPHGTYEHRHLHETRAARREVRSRRRARLHRQPRRHSERPRVRARDGELRFEGGETSRDHRVELAWVDADDAGSAGHGLSRHHRWRAREPRDRRVPSVPVPGNAHRQSAAGPHGHPSLRAPAPQPPPEAGSIRADAADAPLRGAGRSDPPTRRVTHRYIPGRTWPGDSDPDSDKPRHERRTCPSDRGRSVRPSRDAHLPGCRRRGSWRDPHVHCRAFHPRSNAGLLSLVPASAKG